MDRDLRNDVRRHRAKGCYEERLAWRQWSDKARNWYKVIRTMTLEEEIAWVQFKERFEEKFILTSLKNKMFIARGLERPKGSKFDLDIVVKREF